MLMVQSSLSHCQPMFPSPQVDETQGPAPPAVRLTIRLPGSILSWRTLVTPQIHRYKRHLELYNSIPVGKCTWKQVYFRKTLKLFSPCILFGILVHLSSGHMYVSKTFYSLFVNGLFITNTLYYKSSMLYILQKSSMFYVLQKSSMLYDNNYLGLLLYECGPAVCPYRTVNDESCDVVFQTPRKKKTRHSSNPPVESHVGWVMDAREHRPSRSRNNSMSQR